MIANTATVTPLRTGSSGAVPIASPAATVSRMLFGRTLSSTPNPNERTGVRLSAALASVGRSAGGAASVRRRARIPAATIRHTPMPISAMWIHGGGSSPD